MRVDPFLPIAIIPAGNTIGEGILWDSRRQALWWTDIDRSRLYRHDWATRTTKVLPTPERLGSFGLIAGSGTLIAAFASGIGLYDPTAATVEWLARPDANGARVRFNDGRVDRQGRFWTGTMDESEPKGPLGKLYSFDRTYGLRCHRSGIRISNGLCMNPAGTRLYFADSPSRTIEVHDVSEPDGSLGAAKVFARCVDSAVPDGATVDAAGCIWSAQWGGSRVVRYTPDGHEDLRLSIPTRQPTCACFGGPGLDLLFVTTAREGLSDSALRREPHAGDVFVFRPGFTGLPEEEYRS